MSTRYALRLVEGAGQGTLAKTKPRTSDEALLAQFVTHPRRLLRKAGTLTPAKPTSRISRATRLRLTRHPPATSSA